MIEQIEAEVFQGFQTNGRTQPARLTCRKGNGEAVEVFIKFAGAVQGHYIGLCAEVLCSALARHLGFSVPESYLVNLSPEFLAAAPPVAKDLISRSLGLNFGTVAAGPGFSVVPAEPRLSESVASVAANIFAFDVFIQNFDRKWDNPNRLWDGQRIVLIDHESAWHPVLSWPEPSLDRLDLDKFYEHVFYRAISPKTASFQQLASGLQSLTPKVLAGFFAHIPAGWRDEPALSKIREYLHFLVDNHDLVCELVYERIS